MHDPQIIFLSVMCALSAALIVAGIAFPGGFSIGIVGCLGAALSLPLLVDAKEKRDAGGAQEIRVETAAPATEELVRLRGQTVTALGLNADTALITAPVGAQALGCYHMESTAVPTWVPVKYAVSNIGEVKVDAQASARLLGTKTGEALRAACESFKGRTIEASDIEHAS